MTEAECVRKCTVTLYLYRTRYRHDPATLETLEECLNAVCLVSKADVAAYHGIYEQIAQDMGIGIY